MSFAPAAAPKASPKSSAYALYSAREPLKGDGSEDAPKGVEYSLVHRTIFVYGELMAEEVVDALLGLGSGTARSGLRTSKPAIVYGYGRFCMRDSPAPGALAAGDRVRIDGHLLERLQPSELNMIDSFMDRHMERVVVTVQTEDGFGGKREMETLMYTMPTSHADKVDTSRPWDYAEFRAQSMKAYIEEVVKPHRKRAEEQAMLPASAAPA